MDQEKGPDMKPTESLRAAGVAALVCAATAAGAVDETQPGSRAPRLAKDRDRVLAFFAENVYGVRPDFSGFRREEGVEKEEAIAEPASRRISVRINTPTPLGVTNFTATVYVPEGDGPFPVFVMPGFPTPIREFLKAHEGTEPRWPVDLILSYRCATMTFVLDDVLKDDEHVLDGIERAPNEWGAISTWALAASRCADWLETQPWADKGKFAVVGLSRLGKAALWAGATDTRFAMVCPTCSGLFGARMATRNLEGETIERITRVFPHWFAPQCRDKWAGKDYELPFDQHWLLAAVAPRMLCVGSAWEDYWACPPGEMASFFLARQAWEDKSNCDYHVRQGKHGLTPEDWKVYLDFAKSKGW